MAAAALLAAVTLLYAGYNLLIKLSGAHVPASATTTVLATLCLQIAALSTSLLFLGFPAQIVQLIRPNDPRPDPGLRSGDRHLRRTGRFVEHPVSGVSRQHRVDFRPRHGRPATASRGTRGPDDRHRNHQQSAEASVQTGCRRCCQLLHGFLSFPAVPTSIPMVVVFPLPSGPRKPNTWPRSTVNETRSTARHRLRGSRVVELGQVEGLDCVHFWPVWSSVRHVTPLPVR